MGFDLFIGLLRLGRMVCYGATVKESLQLISKYKVGLIVGSTMQIMELLTEQRRSHRKVDSLRRISTGGGPVSGALIKELETTFGVIVEDVYASTEAGAAGISGGELIKARSTKGNRFATLCNIRIVDPDTGGDAQEGLIAVRSRAMGVPYVGEMEQAIPKTEWFFPGDTGRLDSEGRLVLTGRDNEVINFGGVKVTPEAVEEVLIRHPSVSDVAVVRLDRVGKEGAQVVAALVTDHVVSIRDINAWLAQTNMAFQVDAAVVVTSIPRAGSGKVARGELRELLLGVLNKSDQTDTLG